MPPAQADGTTHPELVEWARRLADGLGRDPGVARRALQVGVTEQNLDDADVGSVLQKMGGEAVPQGVRRHLFGKASRSAGGPAGGMQRGRFERPFLVAAGKQPALRAGKPPVAAQNPQQLRRQHDIAVLAALAVLDPDHHPAAVNVGDLEHHHFRHAQAGRVNRGERRAALQARDCLQKAHHLVGAQHHRQLLRLARVSDALRNRRLAERHPVEKAQRADDLVQRSPRDPVGNQVNLEGMDLLKAQVIRRPAEMPAKLRNRVEIGLLRRRRQIADRHVLDHATAQRAHRGHLETSCLKGWACAPTILPDRRRPSPHRLASAEQPPSFIVACRAAASFNLPMAYDQ